MRNPIATAVIGLVLAPAAAAQEPAPAPVVPGEPELRAAVDGLRAPGVAWRQIPWKTCLLEGLIAARREHKPLIYWCQIDRPVDDTRC